MINWIKQLFSYKHIGDLSQHRVHSWKFDDMCK